MQEVLEGGIWGILAFILTGQDKTGEKSRQMEEKWHIRHVDSIPGICSKGSSLQYMGYQLNRVSCSGNLRLLSYRR